MVMERTGEPDSLEGLLSAVLLARLHETGHLVLSEVDLLATELGKADVPDFVLEGTASGLGLSLGLHDARRK
jgi:hypothetical protein